MLRTAPAQKAPQSIRNNALIEKELRGRTPHIGSPFHRIEFCEHGQHLRQRGPPSLDAVRHMSTHVAQAELRCGNRRLDQCAERLRTVGADILIGVLAVRQEEHTHLCRTPAHCGERAQRCLLPRRIAVIAEYNARRAAQEQRCMVARKRGAEGRNDIRYARLPCGNGIHIALGRLRRVEVFRLRIAERAPAESDNAPALIGDRDDDAAAEAVIDPAAALAHYGKPRIDENLLRDAALLERVGEFRPGVRGKSDAVAFDCLVPDAPPRKVCLTRRTVARHGQAVVEEVARERIDPAQIVELAQARLFARIALPLGQRDAELLRLPFNRLERRDMLHERDEFKRIAARVAAEAVEEALGRHDGERCGLFVMEGTAAPVAVALALQGDIALHDGENVGLSAHLLHERLHPRVTHRSLLKSV